MITVIKTRVSQITLRKRIGSYIIATTPHEHLFFSIFLGSLGFIQSLQFTIMLFIQAPVFLYRYPVQIHLIENTVQVFHRTLQIGSISLIEIETIFFQCLSGFFSFGNSLFGQIDICPAREAVFSIPCTLSVTK